MQLSAGDKLKVLVKSSRPLGGRCLGEMYRARDTRLNRDAATELSAAKFSARFEARSQSHRCAESFVRFYDVGRTTCDGTENVTGYTEQD